MYSFKHMLVKNERKFIVLFFVVIGIVLYFPSFNVGYYSDDVAFLPRPDNISPLSYLVSLHPGHRFYRPLEAIYVTTVQYLVGLETTPIHLLNLAGHLILTCLVFYSILRLNFSTLQAVLGAILMLIGQSSVLPLGNVDTISQTLGTVFGYLMLYSIYIYQDEKRINFRRIWYIISISCFVFSLLSKETSIGFIGVAYFLLVYKKLAKQNHKLRDLLRTMLLQVLELLPFLVMLFGYFILRQLIVGATPPSSGINNRYGINLGSNIIVNLVQLLFFAATPVSTSYTIIGLQQHNSVSILISVLFGGIVGTLIVWGLWLIRPGWTLVLIFVILICALFPTFILNHISELHSYNIRPIIAGVEGVCIGYLLEKYRRHYSVYVIYIITIAILLINAISVRTKLNDIQTSASRGAELLNYVISNDQRLKDNNTLVLVETRSPDQPLYSVFVESDQDLLMYSTRYLESQAKINNLRLEFLTKATLDQIKCEEGCLKIELPE